MAGVPPTPHYGTILTVIVTLFKDVLILPHLITEQLSSSTILHQTETGIANMLLAPSAEHMKPLLV